LELLIIYLNKKTVLITGRSYDFKKGEHSTACYFPLS